MEDLNMSTLNLDEKGFVAILVGSLALVTAIQWLAPAKTTSVERPHIYRVASAPAEKPHYAFTYTFTRLSNDCRGEVAVKNVKRCDAEYARAPISETVELRAPATSFASAN
jgi:hypothetical protein